MRKLSTRTRLERLEAEQAKATDSREAWIASFHGDDHGDARRHLVASHSDGLRCWFLERPGPGPQIEDFGKFECVVQLTADEMNM
jgi:hypothetical protein